MVTFHHHLRLHLRQRLYNLAVNTLGSLMHMLYFSLVSFFHRKKIIVPALSITGSPKMVLWPDKWILVMNGELRCSIQPDESIRLQLSALFSFTVLYWHGITSATEDSSPCRLSQSRRRQVLFSSSFLQPYCQSQVGLPSKQSTAPEQWNSLGFPYRKIFITESFPFLGTSYLK